MTYECRHRRLHVNADWYLVEPVDRRGTPVPPGRPSHTTLITNLANTVLPIIRYDIGDSRVSTHSAARVVSAAAVGFVTMDGGRLISTCPQWDLLLTESVDWVTAGAVPYRVVPRMLGIWRARLSASSVKRLPGVRRGFVNRPQPRARGRTAFGSRRWPAPLE